MFNELLFNTGLQGVYTALRDNWLSYIFFALVAFGAIKFLKDREFRSLMIFLIIATIIGVLIFFAPELFGRSGIFTKVGQEGASAIQNTLLLK